jgi:hypothetical protein
MNDLVNGKIRMKSTLAKPNSLGCLTKWQSVQKADAQWGKTTP